jgi:ABC-type polysaccharide/polyol phosphate transport system ATPase subunit
VIQVINVSKTFRIWEDRSRDLKETAIGWLRGKKRSYRDVAALKEINLEIRAGETVAFIGENGSGKSTLLKLLCGIYFPDAGRIVTHGKISTLLELGVGFHPDLTGEENIFLNGAMLGFDEKAMRERFDEIVSFSEIGDFIYSPIRTYSSGMQMRLGFSVAMCVDPDILLIDEVLAVGDEAFQTKCLERLSQFKESGKTIVFVSHSLEMVEEFCGRAILLHHGKVVCDDVPEKTIKTYRNVLYGQDGPGDSRTGIPIERTHTERTAEDTLTADAATQEVSVPEIPDGAIPEEFPPRAEEEVRPEEPAAGPPSYRRYGTFEAEVTGVIIRGSDGEERSLFSSGDVMSIGVRIRFHRQLQDPIIGISISSRESGKLSLIYNTNTRWKELNLGLSKEEDEIEIDFSQRLSLPKGEYYVSAGVSDSEGSRFYDCQEHAKSFRISKSHQVWEGIVDLNSQVTVRGLGFFHDSGSL